MMAATVDGKEVFRSFATLAREKKTTITKQVMDSARRICVDLSFETEPRGFDESAHKQGQQAIKRDIRRVFANRADIYGDINTVNKRAAAAFYAAMNAGEYEKARGIMKTWSKTYPDLPMVNTINPLVHNSRRGGGGRITSRGFSQLVTSEFELDRYIYKVQARSGLAAEGWAECTGPIGGTRGIPAWKKSGHKVSYRKGVTTIDYSGDKEEVNMENLVPYIDSACDSRKMQRAVDREMEVLGDLVDRALQAALRRSNL